MLGKPLIILRSSTPIPIKDTGWIFYNRLDVPFVYNNIESNTTEDDEFGLGDILEQAVLIAPPISERITWGFGVRFRFPTSTNDSLGSELYRVAPIAGIRFNLPEISNESFLALIFKQFFTVGKRDNSREDFRTFEFRPYLKIGLDDGWFLGFWSKDGLIINQKDGRNKDSGDVFLPFDIIVGKRIEDKMLISLNYLTPIIDEYELYDHKIEARVGFFF